MAYGLKVLFFVFLFFQFDNCLRISCGAACGGPLIVYLRGELSNRLILAPACVLTSWTLSDRPLNTASSPGPRPAAPDSQAVRSEFPQGAFVARGDYGINCRESTVSCSLSEKPMDTNLSFCYETALKPV